MKNYTLFYKISERKIAMEELNIKWQAVLEVLREKIVPVSFSTFIEPIRPIELKGNELLLKVTLSYAKGPLEKNYFDTITEALYKVFEFPVTPIFLTNEEAESYEIHKPQVFVPENETDFGLVPGLSFDTFVVGSSNRMAHAASLAVAEMPGEAYNPLYLYGHSGLGKTHLMHAIGNYALGRNPKSKVLYVTSEAFTTELIGAIQTNTTSQFREKYRNIDILMIDDIQFIAGKVSTEEEFFHTFNHLIQSSKQIVVSGDRPPTEMTALEERIRYRLVEGLICDLQPPDYETRMAILKKRCASEDVEFPAFVLEYIAENVVNNIRELKGALSKVKMYSQFKDTTITQSELETLLKDIIAPVIKNFTVEQIIAKVSEYYDIPVDDILSPKQHKEVTLARQVSMFVSRQLTSKSLKAIGRYFNRDHTTVINAITRMEKSMLADATLKESVNTIIHSLRESDY